MQAISKAEYTSLSAGARVLRKDSFGPKVLERPDGKMLKLFRRKRRFSSALVVPYARRFVKIARRLEARGIRTVSVDALYHVPALKRQVVLYDPLAGLSLREEMAAANDRKVLIEAYLAFLLDLHARGIYFRSLHQANVIVGADGVLGLIDVCETWLARGALGPVLRARNLKHLLHDSVDAATLTEYGLARFLQGYIDGAELGPLSSKLFRALLRFQHPLLRGALLELSNRAD